MPMFRRKCFAWIQAEESLLGMLLGMSTSRILGWYRKLQFHSFLLYIISGNSIIWVATLGFESELCVSFAPSPCNRFLKGSGNPSWKLGLSLLEDCQNWMQKQITKKLQAFLFLFKRVVYGLPKSPGCYYVKPWFTVLMEFFLGWSGFWFLSLQK